MRGATSGSDGSNALRRAGRKPGSVVATAATLALLCSFLFLSVSSLTACQGPCQRHSDCQSPWICSPVGVCEPETVFHDPPPDASDDHVRDLPDGALDDSDLADPPPDAGAEPDAT